MSLRIIDLYGEVAADIFVRNFSPDRCVNGTRVALEVMRKFRVPAYPLVTEVIVANKAYGEKLVQVQRAPGPGELEEWYKECGAHGLAVGLGEDPRPDRFEGHLVAIVRGVLLDSAAGQMARPQHNMDVPEILTLDNVSNAFLRGDEPAGIVLPDGTIVNYRAFPDRKHYETTPGFQLHPYNQDIAREIFTEMKRRM